LEQIQQIQQIQQLQQIETGGPYLGIALKRL
jgi:hypothetical protein